MYVDCVVLTHNVVFMFQTICTVATNNELLKSLGIFFGEVFTGSEKPEMYHPELNWIFLLFFAEDIRVMLG